MEALELNHTCFDATPIGSIHWFVEASLVSDRPWVEWDRSVDAANLGGGHFVEVELRT